MASDKMDVISAARWCADIWSGGSSMNGFMDGRGQLKCPPIMNQFFKINGSRRATESNRMRFIGLLLALNSP